MYVCRWLVFEIMKYLCIVHMIVVIISYILLLDAKCDKFYILLFIIDVSETYICMIRRKRRCGGAEVSYV